MNKKLMTVAVASAMAAGTFAAPEAYAQTSTVQMFGRLNFIYGQYDLGGANLGYATRAVYGTAAIIGGATTTYTDYRSGPAGATSINGYAITGTANQQNRPSPGRVDVANDSEAEIGVKGSESVGGGNSVWFQCLTSFDVFGNRASGGTSQWCGRNSALGFKGNFGNVYMGNWDTPMKVVAGNFRPFAVGFPIGLAPMWNGSDSNVGNGGAGAAGFSRRQKNLVTYEMPSMSGFNASFAFSAANEATALTSGSTAQKARLWGLQANYVNGPLIIGGGYERHKNYNPAGLQVGAGAAANSGPGLTATTGNYFYTGGTDAGWNLGAAYTFMGSMKLSAIYTRMNWQLYQGSDVSQTNWGAYADWAISGPHRVRLGYTNVGTTKGSAGSIAAPVLVGNVWANGGAGNTGGSKYHFEYAYALSKRSEVSLGYARQNNDANANFTIGTGGATSANFGETQTYYGLRVSHVF